MRFSLPSRWGLYLLWLQKTYPFNWAHKPLCATYRDDVVRLRSVYLCRSCLLVYLGMASSLCSLTLFSTTWSGSPSFLLALLLSVLLLSSAPGYYKGFSRPLRDLLRFVLGLTLVLVVWQGFHGGWLFSAVAFLACWGAWHLYSASRKRRKLNVCYACRDYSRERVCPGYAMQTARIKEYQEEATEYLLQRGYRPKITEQR
jgi:hypothetical protein